MYRVEPGSPAYPSIHVHRLDAAGLARTETLCSANPDVSLHLAIGDGRLRAHLDRAAALLGERTGPTLALALMACDTEDEERQALDAMRGRADALVLTTPDALDAKADALLRAILAPVAPEHPWCFDWNDMRALCTGGEHAARLAVVRGSDAAAAVDACLRLGGAEPARPARMLLHVALAGHEGMALHFAALRRLQAGVASDSLIGTGISFDPDLAADELVVTLAVFGQPPPRGATSRTRTTTPADLPAFLRQAPPPAAAGA